MSAKHGTGYTIGFATAVCLVCSVFVCWSAVGLRERQEVNKKLDKQENVLRAAGLLQPGEKAAPARVRELFSAVEPVVVDLKTGTPVPDADPDAIDVKLALSKADQSYPAPANPAKVLRLPKRIVVYKIKKDGQVAGLVLPVWGKGLWSTLWGFLAVAPDTSTVLGISFYEHGETPGLGGEIQNPKWTALWPGRKLLDENYEPAFAVVKGVAGSVQDDPHHVDGLSGATLTSQGVTALINFWMGENGYGPFLAKFRNGEV